MSFRIASQSLLQFLALGGGYLLAAWGSIALMGSPATDPALWLPAGVTSAAALLLGWRALPGLALGGVLVAALGLGGDLGGPLLPCLSAAVISLVSPRLVSGKDPFGGTANLVGFLLAAGLGLLVQAPLLGEQTLVGMRALLNGHLLLGPWLATCFRPHGRAQLRASLSIESGAALLTLAALGGLISSDITPALSDVPAFTLLPVLMWASFRLPAPAATTLHVLAGLLLVSIQLEGAATTNGPLTWAALRLGSGTVLMSQLVLVVVLERRRMQRHLQRQADRLRRLVRLRTQELAEANARLQTLSECDGLTGVANRRHFDAELEREWRRALRRSEPLTIGLLDVDHFKAYNDGHGHLEGDEALRRVAEALNAVTGRAEDLLARYGGEEFAVILPGLDRHDASVMAERLRLAVADLAIPHGHGGVDGIVTISGGLVSWVPQAAGNPQELLQLADQLLYAAKARGRNRVLVQAAALELDLDLDADADVTSAAS